MKLEDKISEVIAHILQSLELPHRDSEKYHGLLAYILLQRRRTPKAGADLLDSINQPLAAAFRQDKRLQGIGTEWILSPDNAVLAAMAYSSWMWPLLLDLRCKIIALRESPGFITSDSPVIYYNQFLESRRPALGNIGLLTKGLQIIFPISPRVLLMWYDGRIYKVGNKREDVVWIRECDDVDGLNALQFVSADHNVYFSPDISDVYLGSLARKSRHARSQYHVTVTKYRDVSDPNRGLLHVRPPEIRCDLNLSFVKLQRRLRRVKLGAEVSLPRDQEMLELVHEFIEMVGKGRMGWEDFYPFLVQRRKVKLPLEWAGGSG